MTGEIPAISLYLFGYTKLLNEPLFTNFINKQIMPRLFVLLFVLVLPVSVLANTLEQIQKQLQLQQYDRAATTGLALLRQKPDDLQTLFFTALAFQKNNQPEQARRYYEQIISSHPELPEPRNNLAMVYLRLGEHDRAIDMLIESLNTHPAYATAWQNLSNLYKGLASEAYRKALSEEHNTSSVLDSIQLIALQSLDTAPSATAQIQLAQAPSTQKIEAFKQAAPATAQVAEKPVVTDQPAVDSEPAAKPDKQPSTQPNFKQRLTKTLQDWVRAWDSKAFDDYVNAYTSNYQGNQDSHQQWVEHRRSRVLRADPISVKISNIEIRSYNTSRAIVDFTQAYKSPTYQDRVVKRVDLINIDGNWKITRERTLKVL